MRVSQSVVAQVKNGQVEAAVATAVEAAQMVGRHGGDAHFFMVGAGGEQEISTLFTIEYHSPEALGAAFDAMADDAEVQALTIRLAGPGSPSMVTAVSMAMELPLGHDPMASIRVVVQGDSGHADVVSGAPGSAR